MKPLNISSILIAGLVRDCEKTIERELARIEWAFGRAAKIKMLIIESDSTDGTHAVLEQLARKDRNFAFETLGDLRFAYPKRTDRLAQCRNRYISALKGGGIYQDVDYVVIADLDGANGRLSPEAVASCWERDDWDVCTANQLGPYYDIWALRHKLWSPNDCREQAEFLRTQGSSLFRSTFSSIYGRMICISPSTAWIEVDSAFGGLAVYKKEALSAVTYSGLSESGEEICEHVPTHKQIKLAGGRIFINPGLINSGVSEHARYATSVGFVRFWVRCQLREVALRLGVLPLIKNVRGVLSKQGSV